MVFVKPAISDIVLPVPTMGKQQARSNEQHPSGDRVQQDLSTGTSLILTVVGKSS
jgi:hypothetical protein